MKKHGIAALFSAVIFVMFFSFTAGAEGLPEFDDSSVIVITNPAYSRINLRHRRL